MNEAQVRALVREFWDKVDGGSCSSCTRTAINALGAVFPEWLSVANDEFDRLYEEDDGA